MKKNRYYRIYESEETPGKKSDMEIIENLPPNEIARLEDLIRKATGKTIDADNIITQAQKTGQKEAQVEPSQKTSGKIQNKSGIKPLTKTNEDGGASATVLFLASLAPIVLEAGGGLINAINKKFGITMSRKQWVQYKALTKMEKFFMEFMDTKKNYVELVKPSGEVVHYWLDFPNNKRFLKRETGGKPERWSDSFEVFEEILKKLTYVNSAGEQESAAITDFSFSLDEGEEFKSKEKIEEKNSVRRFVKKYNDFLFENLKYDKFNIILEDSKQSQQEESQKKEGEDKKEKHSQDKHGKSHEDIFTFYYDPEKPDKRFNLFDDGAHHHEEVNLEKLKGSYFQKERLDAVKVGLRIREYIKKNCPVKTLLGNGLKKAGHALHSFYTSIIRGALWLLSWVPGFWWLTEKRRALIANLAYCAIMLWWFGPATIEKLKHIPELMQDMQYANIFQVALKSWKGGTNLKDGIASIANLVKADSSLG